MSTGLPMANTPRNTSADITTSTRALCMSRRRMKTVIGTLGVVPLLLHRMDIEGLGVLARVAFEGEVAAHTPERHLIVERDDAGVLDAGLGRLREQARALLVVDGREGLLEDRVELRVRIAAAVGGAHALRGIVRREQRLQRRGGLAGIGAPAQQHEGEFELAGTTEVDRLRHGPYVVLDARAREHLRHSLLNPRAANRIDLWVMQCKAATL